MVSAITTSQIARDPPGCAPAPVQEKQPGNATRKPAASPATTRPTQATEDALGSTAGRADRSGERPVHPRPPRPTSRTAKGDSAARPPGSDANPGARLDVLELAPTEWSNRDALHALACRAVAEQRNDAALNLLERCMELMTGPADDDARELFVQLCLAEADPNRLWRHLPPTDATLNRVLALADRLAVPEQTRQTFCTEARFWQYLGAGRVLDAIEAGIDTDTKAEACLRAAETLPPADRASVAEALLGTGGRDTPALRNLQLSAYLDTGRWTEALSLAACVAGVETELTVMTALAGADPRSAALRLGQLWQRSREHPAVGDVEAGIAEVCGRLGDWTVPVCAAAAGWTPESPLPDLLVRCLERQPDIHDLLTALEAVSFHAPEARRSFWAAVLEGYVRIRPSTADGTERNNTAFGPQTHAHATASPRPRPFGWRALGPAPRDLQCTACCSDISAGQPVVRFSEGCQPLCPDCAVASLRAAHRNPDQCPFDCGCSVFRQDHLDLGLGAASANNLAARVVQESLAALPEWKRCATADCFVGIAPSRSAHADATATTRPGRTASPNAQPESARPACTYCGTIDRREEMHRDIDLARRLIHDLSAPGRRHGEGVIRECYWCGTPGQKDAECSTVTCKTCKKRWDIVQGEKLEHKFYGAGLPPQRYVPRQGGVLRAMGFYDGLQAGRCGRGAEAQLADKVSRADAWLRAKQREVTLAAVAPGNNLASATAITAAGRRCVQTQDTAAPSLLFMPGDRVCVRGDNGWWREAVIMAVEPRTPPERLRVRLGDETQQGWVSVGDVALWGSRPTWRMPRRGDVLHVSLPLSVAAFAANLHLSRAPRSGWQRVRVEAEEEDGSVLVSPISATRGQCTVRVVPSTDNTAPVSSAEPGRRRGRPRARPPLG